MNSDRELLELAAKACGYNTSHRWNAYRMTLSPPVNALCIGGVSTAWNPLENDGDEARLEATLQFTVQWFPGFVELDHFALRESVTEAYSDHDGDRQAARRRAGVRAAAEIGRQM